MWKVILQSKAQHTLNTLKKQNKKEYDMIILQLIDLEKKGWNFGNLKNIGDGIKRLRVGRWRILCTSKLDNIYIWIIAIEKDTRKDYNKRKKYILSKFF